MTPQRPDEAPGVLVWNGTVFARATARKESGRRGKTGDRPELSSERGEAPEAPKDGASPTTPEVARS